MNAIIFDKLAYVDALRGSGISKDQAAAHAAALDTAMREGTATSSDITQLRHEIELQGAATKAEFDKVRAVNKAEFDAVRAEIGALRSETKAEFDAVLAEIGALKSETKAEFDAMRAEMKSLAHRMTIKLGSMMVAGVTLVLLLDRFFQSVTL